VKRAQNIQIIGAIVLAIAFFFTHDVLDGRADEKIQTKTFEQVQKFVDAKESEGEKVAQALLSNTDKAYTHQHPWLFAIYTADSLTYWSDNEWLPDSSFRNSQSNKLFKSGQNLDLLIHERSGSRDVYLQLALIRPSLGSFEEVNRIPHLYNWDFSISEDSNEFRLPLSNYFLKLHSVKSKRDAGILFVLAWFLLLFAFIKVRRRKLWMTWALALFFVLIRYLSFKHNFFDGANHFKIFDPVLFASNNWLPSLGDLAFHILLALVLVLAVLRTVSRMRLFENRLLAHAAVFVIGAIGFFGTDLVISVIQRLVLDSNLSFDTTQLSNYSLYSFIAFLLMGAMFWIFFSLVNGVLNNESKKLNKWTKIGLFLIAGLGFVVFQMLDAGRSIKSLSLPVIFTFVFLLLRFLTIRWKMVYRLILFLSLFSLLYSYVIYQNQNQREEEYLKIYASKLINSNDLQAEYLFAEMENQLVKEFLVPEDFSSFDTRKDQFEKRLKRLYFSGYLDKYDMKILSFDSIGNNINSSTLYNFHDLNEIYNFSSFPTLSNHFYQIRSTEIANGYLAKFENCDLNGHYGNIFILLEPKFIQSSYSYPELIKKKRDAKLFDLEDYSYVIYNQGRLIHQKGEYSYDLRFDDENFIRQNDFWNWRGYRHFVQGQEEGVYVILSMRNDRLITVLSIFTFAFLFYAVVLGVLAFLRYLFERLVFQFKARRRGRDEALTYKVKRSQFWTDFGFDQLYLSTRIRFAMVALVILGLLISLYFTIQFISFNDANQARSDLMYKIREVAGMVQDEVDLEKKLQNPEARQLIVNEISDVYKVEANIFDEDGWLLVSSESDLFDNLLLAPIMDIEAYLAVDVQGKSQFITEEHIRDLSFLSAYVPLLNDKRQVIGYLNLPYFSRQGELQSKISAYIVTFVNVYFFLIILALALAYLVSKRISKPLQILRDKLSHTGYGQTNEMIDWKRQDEIGQLVKQYNKMVVDLEQSAKRLSESEREGAWKEMARQVAHEIKNPLTPMKLNIQHLQRAWAAGSDKMDQTIERVSRVVIEQIDSLSKLASEFSSFAKMPVDKFEDCDLTAILLNTIHLFEKSENTTFSYDENMPEVHVRGDKDQLGRVFNNILKNAIQAIPEGRNGLIGIQMHLSEASVTVQIRDNGIGIDKEKEAKVFVPNFSTKNSGMGLGLAITKKIIEACEGRIWFTTEIGKGTVFFIQLPTLIKDSLKEN